MSTAREVEEAQMDCFVKSS